MFAVLKSSSKNQNHTHAIASFSILFSAIVLSACNTTTPIDIAAIPTPEEASLHRVPLNGVEKSSVLANTGSAGQNQIIPTSRPNPVVELAHLPANTSNKTKFSSKTFGVAGSPRVTTKRNVKKGGGRYHVGKPYTIRGIKYYPKLDPNLKQQGLASWYGPNFHGRLTANGEIYDQYALSAAHPTMPLPSYAKVTNLENGSSVVVRVNDRGPFSKKRIIDLSARAAQLLGYTKQGVAKVRVEYAGKAPLHGLDEKRLIASYKPGSVDPSTIPLIPGFKNSSPPVVAAAEPVQQQAIVVSQPPVPALNSNNINTNVPRPTGTVNGFILN